MTIALLDGDIIAYRTAAAVERPSWDDTEKVCSPGELRKALKDTVNTWTDKAGASDRRVLLTGAGNFRRTVEPTYKGNRASTVRPVGLGMALEVLRDDYGALHVDGLEADDLIGLMLTGSFADDGIAVSLDKDLRTVPGQHMNPLKDRFPVIVDQVGADRTWMTQVLTGDPVDGYGGCPGIGPVKAAEALGTLKGLTALWQACLAVYASKKLPPSAALSTARLARILRRGDYDKDKKEVLLWHPQTPERLPLSEVLRPPSSSTETPPTPSQG